MKWCKIHDRMLIYCTDATSLPNPMKTDQQVVDECNNLARQFYLMHGCEVPDDYKFYTAEHPMEAGCWNMAVLAYDHIEGTDVESALAWLDD